MLVVSSFVGTEPGTVHKTYYGGTSGNVQIDGMAAVEKFKRPIGTPLSGWIDVPFKTTFTRPTGCEISLYGLQEEEHTVYKSSLTGLPHGHSMNADFTTDGKPGYREFMEFRIAVGEQPELGLYNKSKGTFPTQYGKLLDTGFLGGSSVVFPLLLPKDELKPGWVTVVGEIVLTPGSVANRSVYMSWILHPDYRGRGIMKSAITTMTERLFLAGVHRIVAAIRPENKNSKTLAESCGFQAAGWAKDSQWDSVANEWVDMSYWARINQNDLTRAL